MRKRICLLLSLLLVLTLCGCGAQEAEETTAAATRETVQYGHTVEQEASAEAPAEGSVQPEAQVEVKDAFTDKAVMLDRDETYYYHIPSIRIPGVDATEVNQQMYYELYSFINQYVYENPDYPYLGDMGYMWAVRDGIVSVVTEVVVGPDSSPDPMYVIYNVDISTGLRISDEDLLASFGLSPEDYRAQVEAAVERTYLELYQAYFEENQDDADLTDLYQQQYAKTISGDNVNKAHPYIDESGELCIVADIYSLAGGDSYRHLIALSGAVEPVRPIAEPIA